MESTQTKPKKIHRWIFLVLIVLNILAAGAYSPVMPHVQLPAEKLTHDPIIGNIYLTNTLIALVIADVLLLLIAWSIRRQAKQGKTVFTGIGGIFSFILEFIYNLTVEQNALFLMEVVHCRSKTVLCGFQISSGA